MMPSQQSNPNHQTKPRSTDPRSSDQSVDSRELLRGRRELHIRHEGEVYRLRVTRNGRLILNK